MRSNDEDLPDYLRRARVMLSEGWCPFCRTPFRDTGAGYVRCSRGFTPKAAWQRFEDELRQWRLTHA